MEYVDVEGRATDYTVASDADLLTDRLCASDLPAATATISKLASSVHCSLSTYS